MSVKSGSTSLANFSTIESKIIVSNQNKNGQTLNNINFSSNSSIRFDLHPEDAIIERDFASINDLCPECEIRFKRPKRFFFTTKNIKIMIVEKSQSVGISGLHLCIQRVPMIAFLWV